MDTEMPAARPISNAKITEKKTNAPSIQRPVNEAATVSAKLCSKINEASSNSPKPEFQRKFDKNPKESPKAKPTKQPSKVKKTCT
jgi:hypothetical protein